MENVSHKYNLFNEDQNIDKFITKSFGITCDDVSGKAVNFAIDQKKCLHCGSREFESNMTEPESIVEIEVLTLSHKKWNEMDINQKEHYILEEIILYCKK